MKIPKDILIWQLSINDTHGFKIILTNNYNEKTIIPVTLQAALIVRQNSPASGMQWKTWAKNSFWAECMIKAPSLNSEETHANKFSIQWTANDQPKLWMLKGFSICQNVIEAHCWANEEWKQRLGIANSYLQLFMQIPRKVRNRILHSNMTDVVFWKMLKTTLLNN